MIIRNKINCKEYLRFQFLQLQKNLLKIYNMAIICNRSPHNLNDQNCPKHCEREIAGEMHQLKSFDFLPIQQPSILICNNERWTARILYEPTSKHMLEIPDLLRTTKDRQKTTNKQLSNQMSNWVRLQLITATWAGASHATERPWLEAAEHRHEG